MGREAGAFLASPKKQLFDNNSQIGLPRYAFVTLI